jgi:hypothetical protein
MPHIKEVTIESQPIVQGSPGTHNFEAHVTAKVVFS